MSKKLKLFLIGIVLGGVLFFLSTKTSLADAQSSLFYFSLNFQKIFQDLLSKILPQPETDTYKEKYFKLLEELAKLKLSLKEIKETEILPSLEKYKEKVVEVSVFKKDEFGYLYIQNFKGIKEGMIVLDKNWVLIGRVVKVYKNYSLVESLLVGDLKFNVSNLNGELLGLGQTLSNGFLEIRFVPLKMDIKEDEFILTYGDDLFPSGLLIGSVSKALKSSVDQRIIVKLLGDFNAKTLLILK